MSKEELQLIFPEVTIVETDDTFILYNGKTSHIEIQKGNLQSEEHIKITLRTIREELMKW